LPDESSPTAALAGKRYRLNCHNRMVLRSETGPRGVKRNVTTPAIWGETHFGLTAPTTISRVSTWSRPKETGRSGSVSSTISCCGWVFGWAALRPARSANSTRPRSQRRSVADAAPVAQLCRGQVEPAGRRAGDQPARPFGRSRPPRDHRRLVFGAPAVLPHRHCSASSARKPCPALNKSRPTTNCSTTRAATAAPAITPAAPA
jgi:hypothetical protein